MIINGSCKCNQYFYLLSTFGLVRVPLLSWPFTGERVSISMMMVSISVFSLLSALMQVSCNSIGMIGLTLTGFDIRTKSSGHYCDISQQSQGSGETENLLSYANPSICEINWYKLQLLLDFQHDWKLPNLFYFRIHMKL